MSKVLLIDAYNMIHRSRFGWGTGEHSITFNFFRALRSEINRHEPTKLYIVSEGRPIHRIQESNGEYKGNRESVLDEGFHRQKKEIFELCKYLPATFIRHPDYECDDVIGTLTSKYSNEGSEVVICSSDSDFIQLLINEGVSLWNPVRKKFIERWPVDYLTWKGLKGDPTDNIPGIKGVGAKTATKLAESPDLLEEFLNKKPDRRNTYESAKRLIKLIDIPWTCEKWIEEKAEFDEQNLFIEFKKREFKTIIGNAWKKWINTMESVYE
jgi:DNA polymerase I